MAIGRSFGGIRASQDPKGLIDVDIKPLPFILVGQFNALAFSVRSYREPLTAAVKMVVIPSIKLNFDVNGRPAWKDWAAETMYRREYEGYGSGLGDSILVRKGKLKRAAQAFARWTITKDSAIASGQFPGSAWYGPLHQRGFTGGHGAQVPARPFMLIQNEDVPKIEAIFSAWLAVKVKTHI